MTVVLLTDDAENRRKAVDMGIVAFTGEWRDCLCSGGVLYFVARNHWNDVDMVHRSHIFIRALGSHNESFAMLEWPITTIGHVYEA
jgi:hypothetical protein